MPNFPRNSQLTEDIITLRTPKIFLFEAYFIGLKIAPVELLAAPLQCNILLLYLHK
nr:MAG TPA: hypothetical protein [Caudoviricetes sp.]